MSRTIGDMLRQTRMALQAAGIDSAARDARALVALVTGRDVSRLTLEAHEQAGERAWERWAQVLPERKARRPLSHITRRRSFWKHDFIVTPDVLDPRPETEILVEAALDGPVAQVLDLGTGSGAILLSVLSERPEATGLGVDLSDAALDVARQNAEKLDLADRVTLQHSNWFTTVTGQFDLILSNPPYIAATEMADLAPELGYEPRIALTDEADGLTAYRAIAAGTRAHLRPGGRLLVEIGPTQGAAVREIFLAAGLSNVALRCDLDGRDRVVVAKRPEGAKSA